MLSRHGIARPLVARLRCASVSSFRHAPTQLPSCRQILVGSPWIAGHSRTFAAAPDAGLLPDMIADYGSFYADAYTLRRDASTMQSNMLAWLRESSASHLQGLALKGEAGRPLRIVSIGCGGGELDLAMMESLSSLYSKAWGYTGIEFIGMEPSTSLLSEFRDRVREAQKHGKVPDNLNVSFVEEVFNASAVASDRVSGADIVFMGHVLYYFDDKAEAIRAALQLARPEGGKLMIVHQAAEGVPELQKELLPELRGTLKDSYTADDISEALSSKRLSECTESSSRHDVDAFLDLSDISGGNEAGMKIMSFCLEADHRTANGTILKKSRDAFLAKSVPSAEPGRQGGPFMREPVSAFIISRRP